MVSAQNWSQKASSVASTGYRKECLHFSSLITEPKGAFHVSEISNTIDICIAVQCIIIPIGAFHHNAYMVVKSCTTQLPQCLPNGNVNTTSVLATARKRYLAQ